MSIDLSSGLVGRAQARTGDRANLDDRVADPIALPFEALDAGYSERVFSDAAIDDVGRCEVVR